MATLRSRCGHYILQLWFLFLLPFFFSLTLDVYHTCTRCGLSANLECMSEMCCTWLTENTWCKNYAKKSPSGNHRTTSSGYIFASKARIDNRKKRVKQQYLLHMFSQYGELRPTNGWDLLRSLGHPNKSRFGFVTAPTSLNRGQPNFAQCLTITWAGTLYVHFWRLLPPNGILSSAKFTLPPSLAFSYIGSITAQHSSIGRQRNFAAWDKEWNYGTFADGATYI